MSALPGYGTEVSDTRDDLRVIFAHTRADDPLQPSARVLRRVACFWAWVKQFPVAFGDDLDSTVDHFDRGLIVDRVRRDWYFGGHFSTLAKEESSKPSRSRCTRSAKPTNPSARSPSRP